MKSFLWLTMALTTAFSVAACSTVQAGVQDHRKPASEKSFDGFPITVVVDKPANQSYHEVRKVVVFAHGSGPQNSDGDLSAITTPKGTQNFIYRDISDALVKKGFAAVRYNKRAFETKLRLESDPNYKTSEEYKAFQARPLQYFIDDHAFFADYAKKTFPKAEVYLLGHSEGTTVVLNVAKKKPFIKGVALIGFSNETISTSLFEQTVYRPLVYFREVDKNRDEVIDQKELSQPTELSQSLKKQLSVLDRNKDGKIDLSEYKAGNYSNLVLNDGFYIPGYLKDEASLPRPSSIIREAKFKILFLQGEWDNQTPAYHAQAIQLANENVWKKPTIKFHFFPRAGHALDPRDSVNDLSYRQIPGETLEKISTEMEGFFR